MQALQRVIGQGDIDEIALGSIGVTLIPNTGRQGEATLVLGVHIGLSGVKEHHIVQVDGAITDQVFQQTNAEFAVCRGSPFHFNVLPLSGLGGQCSRHRIAVQRDTIGIVSSIAAKECTGIAISSRSTGPCAIGRVGTHRQPIICYINPIGQYIFVACNGFTLNGNNAVICDKGQLCHTGTVNRHKGVCAPIRECDSIGLGGAGEIRVNDKIIIIVGARGICIHLLCMLLERCDIQNHNIVDVYSTSTFAQISGHTDEEIAIALSSPCDFNVLPSLGICRERSRHGFAIQCDGIITAAGLQFVITTGTANILLLGEGADR